MCPAWDPALHTRILTTAFWGWHCSYPTCRRGDRHGCWWTCLESHSWWRMKPDTNSGCLLSSRTLKGGFSSSERRRHLFPKGCNYLLFNQKVGGPLVKSLSISTKIILFLFILWLTRMVDYTDGVLNTEPSLHSRKFIQGVGSLYCYLDHKLCVAPSLWGWPPFHNAMRWQQGSLLCCGHFCYTGLIISKPVCRKEEEQQPPARNRETPWPSFWTCQVYLVQPNK